MNKLRIHFIIVLSCCFSFLLMTGWFIVSKGKTAFDTNEKPMVEANDNHKYRLMKLEKFKNTGSRKNELQAVKNGRLR